MKPSKDHLRQALNKIGIEVISFANWPGYKANDLIESANIQERIVHKWEDILGFGHSEDLEGYSNLYDKAKPEAEAFLIVQNERQGQYHMISAPGQVSSTWFVSQTSMLNLVQIGSRIDMATRGISTICIDARAKY